MSRSTNRQSRNVGNLGDIIKHAALVQLASMLADRCGSVSYVDTHTFLLHAPLANREQWSRDLSAFVSRHPAYARYAELERASLARTEHYRCSSGLVIDVLGERRASTVLGEANARTRGELNEQLAEEGLSDVLVVDDGARVSTGARVPTGAGLLIHVDPFSLPPETWASVAPAVDALVARSPDTVVVLYRYTRTARAPWPAAPAGTMGPITEILGQPHEVAAYASPGLAGLVRELTCALGWRAPSERPRDPPRSEIQ